MKYVVDTIVERILECTNRESKIHRVVLPSYPARLLLKIGCRLEEEFRRILSRSIRLEYGIAYRLGKEWQEGTEDEKVCFTHIRDRDWYDEQDNLTRLRNIASPQDCDCLVVLLAGYEHIDEKGSLQDFYHLNEPAVWEECLRKSFRDWVCKCLKDYVNLDDSHSYVVAICDVLNSIYNNTLVSILGVSNFLESLDFSAAEIGQDAYRIVLESLPFFNLPPMIGLVHQCSPKRRFSSYIEPANSFFKYDMFLDSAERLKKLKIVEAYRQQIQNQPPDLHRDVLGCFATYEDPFNDFLNALEIYVKNGSESCKEQLMTVDFIYMYNDVLGYQIRNGPPTPRRIQDISGLPPEVFLHALWIALRELGKQKKSSPTLTFGDISQVTLESVEFRHNFDDADSAKTFLCKVLGGIDGFLKDQLRLRTKANHDGVIDIESCLSPQREESRLSYRKHSTAKPFLKFQVLLSGHDHRKPFMREFRWVLPQYHQSRLLVELYDWAFERYREGSNSLPVFAVPYMNEVFMARDRESINRITGMALESEKRSVVNLLASEGMDDSDDIADLLIGLSISHQVFVKELCEHGFFNALYGKYDELRIAYHEAFEAYLERSDESILGPLLMKAFMIVSEDNLEDPGWVWNKHLKGVLVTPLHPALLEMIVNQHAFLCESLCHYASTALEGSAGNVFSEKRWDSVVELSGMHWPVFGILSDSRLTLDTSVSSYDYMHLVGHSNGDFSSVTATLLLEDESTDEDEDITDTDLFRETGSSQLILRVLRDYRDLHEFADDGISVGAYCGGDIQPIIAGINSYLAYIAKERSDRIYSLRLTMFSDSQCDSALLRWVKAWKERWQQAELSPSKRHYSNCEISISYRVISSENHFEQLESLIRDSCSDVMFFISFIGSDASNFELLGENKPAQMDYRKFPILEKICCRVSGGGMDCKRERILSNQRFQLGALHAEVMARIQKGHRDPCQAHVIINTCNFQPWLGVMDVAHDKSGWVVCIDPCIDEQLLRKSSKQDRLSREIIGFGAGVGSHGENNYTISTEQFSMDDICTKIGLQVSQLLGPVESEIAKQIAESLIQEAKHMAGLSIVKATGRSEYVRDYMAYSLVRKLLPKDDKAFCDEIISLDAFWHWFDYAEERKRPDLLRLRAHIVDGYFNIEAQIIECKLGMQSSAHLDEARQQIENGIKQLAVRFRPRESTKPIGIGDMMPDQRFWWMQLHRLIAGKGATRRPEYRATLRALERLSDGYFNITWQAAAVAFWTDIETSTMYCRSSWQLDLDDQEFTISVATAGKDFIIKVCLENATGDLFCNDSSLSYEYTRLAEDPVISSGIQVDPRGGRANVPAQPEATAAISSDDITEDDDKNEVELPSRIPNYIPLGSFTMGGREVCWEFGHPDLPNRHIIVFGASGTGKTYTIQALLWELAKAGQNSLIVDYTNGFSTAQLEPLIVESLRPVQHVVRTSPVPINPFRRQCDYIDDQPLPETSAGIARRVADLFAGVYELGDQQRSVLYKTIRDGVDEEGDNFDLAGLVIRLDKAQHKGGPIATSAMTLLSKIRPFVDMNPFGQEDEESWERLFTDVDSRCHIIQMAGFTKDSARLITEFSLFDFYWYYRANGNKDRPRVVVLDEIQNLDHGLDSPIGQLLTEGRKFGISLILATQTMSNLAKEERDRLFQACHKLFFKPADTEVRSFAQILADSTNMSQNEWVERLSSLKRGECYSLGHALDRKVNRLEVGRSFRIRIKSLEDRI